MAVIELIMALFDRLDSRRARRVPQRGDCPWDMKPYSDNDSSFRERWEIALGLFGMAGVGLALAAPEAWLLGVIICLGSIVGTLILYRDQFARLPYWVCRHRVHLPLRHICLPRDTVLAIAVVLISISAPIYAIYTHFPAASSLQPASHSLENNFYASFSFIPPLGVTAENINMKLRFLNREENGVLIENIGAIELFGRDTEPYRQLDLCYDPNVFEIIRTESDSDSNGPTRSSQGGFATRPLQFVTYAQPTNITLDGKAAGFPLEIPPNMPIVIDVTFPLDPTEKKRPGFNFFVVCPSIKLFDTRRQESVSLCPGLIEMVFSKEEYSAESYRVARLIPRENHLGTMGPFPPTGDVYRVFAHRPGQFQLTPRLEGNTCPRAATD
jgi:hypothetical protein